MHQEVKQHPTADTEVPLQQLFERELTTQCEVIGIFAAKRTRMNNSLDRKSWKEINKNALICFHNQSFAVSCSP